MKSLLLAVLALPGLALGASPFDGTWKIDLATVKSTGKPFVLAVKNGTYHCNCAPPITVPADGMPHPVSGHAYYDAMTVRIVGDSEVDTTATKEGKTVSTTQLIASGDGRSLIEKFTDDTGPKTVKGNMSYQRVGKVVAGAHAVSGSWQGDSLADLSDAARTVDYKSTEGGIKLDWSGENYDAKFDGKSYPMNNDPGHTTVVVKMQGARTLLETDTRDGKVVDVIRSTVSADGKSMQVSDRDPRRARTTSYTMTKS